MPSYNKVVLVGNLTRDPEVRYIPSRKAVCEFALAINETYFNAEREEVKKVVYVDVVLRDKKAEVAGEHLKKGSLVLVDGKLQLDKWEDKDGNSRQKTESPST